MVTKKSWDEFRSTGLLLIINQILHIFGWAIVCEYDDETHELIEVYPARCKFRGFASTSVDNAYLKVSKYMAENASELLTEVEEGIEGQRTDI